MYNRLQVYPSVKEKIQTRIQPIPPKKPKQPEPPERTHPKPNCI